MDSGDSGVEGLYECWVDPGDHAHPPVDILRLYAVVANDSVARQRSRRECTEQ